MCSKAASCTGPLGQALADEVSGDPEAVRDLLRFEEMDVAVSVVSRWRQQHEQALIIVDQFEELFTQTPPGAQECFAELLGRLPLEADIFVPGGAVRPEDNFVFDICRDTATIEVVRSGVVINRLQVWVCSGYRGAVE